MTPIVTWSQIVSSAEDFISSYSTIIIALLALPIAVTIVSAISNMLSSVLTSSKGGVKKL